MAELEGLRRRDRPGRGSLPEPPPGPQASFLKAVPYIFVAAVVIADLTTARDITFTPMLSVVPALAALGSRSIRGTLTAAAVAAVALGLLSWHSKDVSVDVPTSTIAALATVSAVSCVSISMLRQQSQILANVRSVAEAAQHVVLRNIPEDLGQVRTAYAYEAAAAEALIGGDLYEGFATPHGDRFIIGDVRGKGLPAVEAAADVLGVFREAAHTEPDLAAVAARLHDVMARRPVRDEEFVTAALLSISPDTGSVEIVNCGHPAPLLLRAGRVAALAPDDPGPPLGLFDLADAKCQPYHARFVPGDTLLLYTDGTTEARNAEGVFFPLTEYLGGAAFESPGELVDLVRAGLRGHAGELLDDDVALVALQRKANVIVAEGDAAADAVAEPVVEAAAQAEAEAEAESDLAASGDPQPEPQPESQSEPQSDPQPEEPTSGPPRPTPQDRTPGSARRRRRTRTRRSAGARTPRPPADRPTS